MAQQLCIAIFKAIQNWYLQDIFGIISCGLVVWKYSTNKDYTCCNNH